MWKLLCETHLALRGWFVSPNTPARGQSFINSDTSYDYESANDNYVTMMESFVNKLSLQVASVDMEKVLWLSHVT